MALNRKYFVLWGVSMFLFFAFVVVSDAAIINATSASYSDVNTAVSNANSGDTVNVPAGSAIWDDPLVITEYITLQGAGIGNTVVTSNITNKYSGVIEFDPATPSSANLIRITGFTIDCDSKSNGIYIDNDSSTPVGKLRIDHNRIINAGGVDAGRTIYIKGAVWGVADNNTLEGSGHIGDAEGYNTTAWDNLSREFGSANNFYFEDNTVTSGNIHAGGHGGRYVSRYNDWTNTQAANVYPVLDMHGNQAGGITAMMVAEIYGNDLDFGNYGGRPIDQRGGMLMAFFNKWTYGGNSPYMYVREEVADPDGYLMHVTNSYYWNNRKNTTLFGTSILSDCCAVLNENSEFWNHNESYNGTTEIGVYCGDTLPAHCTTGDGAWITTQSCSDLTGLVGVNPSSPISGTFYKCTAPNTWTEYYTPYTYPHPLRIPAAIENFRMID